MNEIEEYYYTKNTIESIKETLISYGYSYNERHGWYRSENRPLDKEQERIATQGIKRFPEYVKRFNELNAVLDL